MRGTKKVDYWPRMTGITGAMSYFDELDFDAYLHPEKYGEGPPEPYVEDPIMPAQEWDTVILWRCKHCGGNSQSLTTCPHCGGPGGPPVVQ